MKIDLDGLSVADYRVSLSLADVCTLGSGISVFDGRFPVDALAERLASLGEQS
jgi:hypothetical protein